MGRILLAVLCVLFCTTDVVYAADGDNCTGVVGLPGGTCKMLCDSDTGDVSCADLRIPNNASGNFTVEIHNQTGCSACDVDVNWTSESGNDEHDIVTLSCGGTTAYTVDSGVRIPGYITGTISGTAGPCTDLDVFVHFE